MNRLLVWVSAILVVVFGGRALVNYMSRSANEEAASTRVAGFLRGMSAGGDFQNAFNMWERGAAGAIQDMTQDQYNVEVGRLNAWLAARDLGPRVGHFEVRGAAMIAPPQGVEGAAVAVSCTIDGKDLTILAIKDRQLDWLD